MGDLVVRVRLRFLVSILVSTSGWYCTDVTASPFSGRDDGYRLWLKYDRIEDTKKLKKYQKQISGWRVDGESSSLNAARYELAHALPGLLGSQVVENNEDLRAGTVLVGTPKTSRTLARLGIAVSLAELGDEGFTIMRSTMDGDDLILIAANTDVGALYGVFHFLRLLQTNQDIDQLHVRSAPAVKLRLLNHWDNLDRDVERGYAGASIWDWHKLPLYRYQRYYDYARANASIGINGTVLNNVNADPLILTPGYLQKVAALADIMRPYGIRVFLSVKFSSPSMLGGLATSDPLNPEVRRWWRDKADEIYTLIPDFGGFLVKANSEGQPGPGDYQRTHADGANMLARALAPYGGVVMWRAFVYDNDPNVERSLQAYREFKPQDGKFDDNVLLQVKNGPIDFQPREPINPLFGAMQATSMMLEFQITMEYLGFSTHFVYLGPLYKETLTTDTFARGKGSTVAKVVDGRLFDRKLSGMAGVANIGTDRNWTGHVVLQSNWFVFGRLAWNPRLTAAKIANEWVRMTLSNDNRVVEKVSEMMMASRENTVNYMTPLGLHHIMGVGHHYGPGPWVDDLPRADWTSVYYHNADANGIGFDRTESGSNAIAQYFPPLRRIYSSADSIPEKFLLWFHHLPWDYEMRSGNTLWEELVLRYYAGVQAVEDMAKTWDGLEGKIDQNLFLQAQMAFDIQVAEARWWRDACVLYFQSKSQLPLPKGADSAQRSLSDYRNLQFPYAPGGG